MYKAAYERYTHQAFSPARATVATPAPGPPAPAPAPATPAAVPTATALLHDIIHKQQRLHPGLPDLEALNRVNGVDPALWEQHRQALLFPGHPFPVAKEVAVPSYDEIVAIAKAEAARTAQTTEDVLNAWAMERKGVYWEAARRWRLFGEGQQEHQEAQLAKRQEGSRHAFVYSPPSR
jgi:hypothetical protein